MAETIEFDQTYLYNIYDIGITVPVQLFYSDKDVEFDAKVDTGSTYCIFQRLHGELLGLEIENGIPVNVNTATGNFRAFGHGINLNGSRHRIRFDRLFCRKRLFR
jgi:hypothetical protein